MSIICNHSSLGFFFEDNQNNNYLETDDESFLDSGLLEHLIECYPITTAEDVSVISILCDICLNEYKSDDKR
ncbi:unnamed protein product [Rotaria sordida]|uniref:Uncharacterized protein n=1 Tax=Rotaria sordida TaxID=392033 RepID=A0A818XFZ0_9BILA|nr:unnamed protein product [Rotaria sordida]